MRSAGKGERHRASDFHVRNEALVGGNGSSNGDGPPHAALKRTLFRGAGTQKVLVARRWLPCGRHPALTCSRDDGWAIGRQFRAWQPAGVGPGAAKSPSPSFGKAPGRRRREKQSSGAQAADASVRILARGRAGSRRRQLRCAPGRLSMLLLCWQCVCPVGALARRS